MIKENFLVAIDFTRKLVRSRYMLRMMALHELKASYVGSVFGVSWAVLNPLLQLAIYGVVFGVFFRSTPDPRYGTDSYFLFLLCGLVPWQFFAQTVTTTSGSITGNFALVKKAVGFPAEILPLVTVVSNLIGHFISILLLLAAVLLFAGGIAPTTPLMLVYLFFIALFSIGLGWVLAGVNVFLKDIQQIIGLAMMGWFFFTPIIYAPNIVPPVVLPILKLNPLYHMVEGYRLALLSGQMLPAPDFAYLAVSSFVTLAAGGVVFRKLKPWFAEVL